MPKNKAEISLVQANPLQSYSTFTGWKDPCYFLFVIHHFTIISFLLPQMSKTSVYQSTSQVLRGWQSWPST